MVSCCYFTAGFQVIFSSSEGHTAVTRLPLPPPIVTANTDQSDRRIRPRSAHFIKNGKVLIVCYLNHGIV